MYFEQVNTFSDVSHYEKSRVVATSYLALVDIMTLKLKQEERKVAEVCDCPKCEGKIIEKKSKKFKVYI